jgi:miniconductance mechanosensitive channel
MEAIWNMVHKWVMSSGLDAAGARAAASALCVAATIGVSSGICAMLSAVARHLMSKIDAPESHKKKSTTLIRTATWTAFAWFMFAWLPDAANAYPAIAKPMSRILYITTVILFTSSIASVITWLREMAGDHAQRQAFASKTLSQMAKILLWFTAGIIVASELMGKSPAFVLSGLGALTAVLMLIFRDSLLGLVAGIQVSQNDMVRVGDWITMPKYNADGNVIDIALTTVKVQNFDNTVTMIPSSALISDAFINWRYMSVSKGRRIKRPVWISVMSVKEISPELRESLINQGLLKAEDAPVSNLAAFEIWLRRMLKANENITQELTCMVRQTEAEDTGIPVEVYAFTKTRDWVEYENIQTDIFDQIFVTVPKFGLQVYQRSSDKLPLEKPERA